MHPLCFHCRRLGRQYTTDDPKRLDWKWRHFCIRHQVVDPHENINFPCMEFSHVHGEKTSLQLAAQEAARKVKEKMKVRRLKP